MPYSIQIIDKLRQQKINSEIYVNPDDKLDKQLKYADKKGIPFVVIAGPDEAKNKTVSLKNMTMQKQEIIKIDQLSEYLI